MAQKIGYEDDISGSASTVKGSNGRLNVSSRSDSRGYYVSRDQEQAYSIVFNHPSSSAGQYSLYLQNTSSTLAFVISGVGLNSDLGANVKLWKVTGTAANGSAITAINMASSDNAAALNCIEDGGGTPISGITLGGALDYVKVPIEGHEELRLDDRVRLGQNQAIVLEVDAVTSGTPHVFGVLFGFFES